MATLQIEVSEHEKDLLHALEKDTGKSQDELLRMALSRLLAREAGDGETPADLSNEERLERLRAARGIWADHTDLPENLHAWRLEQDRAGI